MYIAKTYIGGAYTPGDVLPDDFPAEKLEWLIQAGAVREAAPAPSADTATEESAKDAEPAPETQEIDEADEFEDEDAPEIDVMAGIVKNAEPEKPARKPRTSAGKKPPKGGKTK